MYNFFHLLMAIYFFLDFLSSSVRVPPIATFGHHHLYLQLLLLKLFLIVLFLNPVPSHLISTTVFHFFSLPLSQWFLQQLLIIVFHLITFYSPFFQDRIKNDLFSLLLLQPLRYSFNPIYCLYFSPQLHLKIPILLYCQSIHKSLS